MSVVSFQNKIYLSTYDAMYVIENDAVKKLDTGHEVQGRRLMSNGDELWAKDSNELWRFDGATWTKIEVE